MSTAPKRTLLLSSFAPVLGNGRAMRTHMIVRALAQLAPLDVAYVPFEADEPSPEYLAIPGVRYIPVPASRGRRRLLRYAQLRLRGVPVATAKPISPELLRAARQLGEQPDRGLIVTGDPATMVACFELARQRPVVYAAQNVHSSYEAGSDGDEAGVRRLERRIFSAASESWMVSARDVALARELAPQGRFRYVPNVVDADRIVPATPGPRPRRRILMVGDHSYPPNAEGSRWLVDEVLPLVREALPDVHLTIVGRDADAVVDAGPGIEVLGFVDDLAAQYHAADVVGVPLFDGGGSPLKFVEALAYGVPVVATPVAAQGLDVRAGEHFRLAEDPATFAAQLVASLEGDDAGLAAAARGLVEREYSLQALVRLLRVEL